MAAPVALQSPCKYFETPWANRIGIVDIITILPLMISTCEAETTAITRPIRMTSSTTSCIEEAANGQPGSRVEPRPVPVREAPDTGGIFTRRRPE